MKWLAKAIIYFPCFSYTEFLYSVLIDFFGLTTGAILDLFAFCMTDTITTDLVIVPKCVSELFPELKHKAHSWTLVFIRKQSTLKYSLLQPTALVNALFLKSLCKKIYVKNALFIFFTVNLSFQVVQNII